MKSLSDTNMLPVEIQEYIDKIKESTAPWHIGYMDLKSCVYQDTAVISNNTVGSDDYHPYNIEIIHNAKLVFECKFKPFFTITDIYKKIDPNKPAYFVVVPREGQNIMVWKWK